MYDKSFHRGAGRRPFEDVHQLLQESFVHEPRPLRETYFTTNGVVTSLVTLRTSVVNLAATSGPNRS